MVRVLFSTLPPLAACLEQLVCVLIRLVLVEQQRSEGCLRAPNSGTVVSGAVCPES